jgi:hypothetical protein
VRKFWQFTLVGLVLGIILGWLLSLASGNIVNIVVIIGVGSLGMVVGIVLGIIHRNDP